jgi:hypothetical protein
MWRDAAAGGERRLSEEAASSARAGHEPRTGGVAQVIRRDCRFHDQSGQFVLAFAGNGRRTDASVWTQVPMGRTLVAHGPVVLRSGSDVQQERAYRSAGSWRQELGLVVLPVATPAIQRRLHIAWTVGSGTIPAPAEITSGGREQADGRREPCTGRVSLFVGAR